MFSNSQWSQKADNINQEINGLQQRRNQTGTRLVTLKNRFFESSIVKNLFCS